MLHVLLSAFDALPRQGTPRHLFIDPELTERGWIVTIRAKDHYVVGSTNHPERAPLVFNDVEGEYVPFEVAVAESELEATAAAGALREFFTRAAPLSDRLRYFPADYLLTLALVLARFDASAYTAGNHAARRCESFYASENSHTAALVAVEV